MKVVEIKSRVKKAVTGGRYHKDIRSVALFGSQLKRKANHGSDVDLLIDFDPKAVVGFIKFFSIQEDLEKALGKKVDLVVRGGVSPHLRKEILAKSKLIYER